MCIAQKPAALRAQASAQIAAEQPRARPELRRVSAGRPACLLVHPEHFFFFFQKEKEKKKENGVAAASCSLVM